MRLCCVFGAHVGDHRPPRRFGALRSRDLDLRRTQLSQSVGRGSRHRCGGHLIGQARGHGATLRSRPRPATRTTAVEVHGRRPVQAQSTSPLQPHDRACALLALDHLVDRRVDCHLISCRASAPGAGCPTLRCVARVTAFGRGPGCSSDPPPSPLTTARGRLRGRQRVEGGSIPGPLESAFRSAGGSAIARRCPLGHCPNDPLNSGPVGLCAAGRRRRRRAKWVDHVDPGTNPRRGQLTGPAGHTLASPVAGRISAIRPTRARSTSDTATRSSSSSGLEAAATVASRARTRTLSSPLADSPHHCDHVRPFRVALRATVTECVGLNHLWWRHTPRMVEGADPG